ncbi:MAG: hypothetical protein GY719_02210 [bacterium]|nr:hypothetical protein [bacterium]
MTDEKALRLHDRFVLGETLTDEESVRLEAWYASQDAVEASEPASAGTETVDLKSRLRSSLEQVAEAARQIQRTMTENDSLRREIAGLRLELSQQAPRSA